MPAPDTTVAHIARASWGRLVALLAARTGDIAAAEDFLAEAFARAVGSWTEASVPPNPDAWLLTVARNLQRDTAKSSAVRLATSIDPETIDMPAPSDDREAIPDRRLELMFACAHPAIDEAVRTPLMLQIVLGLEATDIAKTFLIAPATMAQRLMRAKQKIKLARIPFALPDRNDMPERMEAVLEAIYGAYAIDWQLAHDSDGDLTADLGVEALYLADLLAQSVPDDPETAGLAALISFTEARRAARRGEGGAYVPLDKQNTSLWRPDLIQRAEWYLRRAHSQARLGRFQLEAAIQSAHVARKHTGVTDWTAIVHLYEAMVRIAPSVGAAVGLAAAVGRAQGPVAGLACLDAYRHQIEPAFQPAWATRVHLAAAAGRSDEARRAFLEAVELSRDPAETAFLMTQMRQLSHGDPQ